eukprot:768443-Hanusia_phi.AAC.3
MSSSSRWSDAQVGEEEGAEAGAPAARVADASCSRVAGERRCSPVSWSQRSEGEKGGEGRERRRGGEGREGRREGGEEGGFTGRGGEEDRLQLVWSNEPGGGEDEGRAGPRGVPGWEAREQVSGEVEQRAVGGVEDEEAQQAEGDALVVRDWHGAGEAEGEGGDVAGGGEEEVHGHVALADQREGGGDPTGRSHRRLHHHLDPRAS